MNDEDIYDNFVGVFPLNHMNKLIDTAAMLSEKKGKCPFVIPNTDSSEKGELTVGVYLISSQKQTFSSLVFLD